VKDKVKEQWGKLTDDDLDVIAGKQDNSRDVCSAKDQANSEVYDWYDQAW
jgi:uncharacterized protein YjbJ (UPF0337 family)